MLACARGLFHHAVELLDAGAELGRPHWSSGQTPLMMVISHCSGEHSEESEEFQKLFEELMERNVDSTAVDNKQMSALHYACKAGNVTMCSSLLNAGVDLDVQNSDGVTALCLASSLVSDRASTSHELAGLLIARGSYPRIRDQHGRQAIHYAAGTRFFARIISS
jgi:ankyrin repeat protein